MKNTKKLCILLFILIVVCLKSQGGLAQEFRPFTIEGPVLVKPGDRWGYKIVHSSPLPQGTYFKINLTLGSFSDEDDEVQEKTISISAGKKESSVFYVRWGSVDTKSEGLISVHSFDAVSHNKLKVTISPDKPIVIKPDETSVDFRGLKLVYPKEMYVNEVYKITYNKSEDYTYCTNVDWDLPLTPGITKIAQDKNSITIKVTSQIDGESLTPVTLRARFRSGWLGYGRKTRTYDLNIKTKGIPYLDTQKNNICGNEQITYIVKNLQNFKQKENYSWKAGNQTILVNGDLNSGVGKTSNTNYTGYITMNYSIKTERGIYNIDNSKVWVGIPRIGFDTPVDDIYKPGQTYYLRVKSEPYGVPLTNPSWNVIGDAKIFKTESNLNLHIAHIQIPQIVKGGSFDILLSANTTCGVAKFGYTGSVEKSEGGGLPPVGDGGIIMRAITVDYKQIEIFNFPSGTLVKKVTETSNFDINNQDLTPGIYLIRYKDQNNNVTTEKVKL